MSPSTSKELKPKSLCITRHFAKRSPGKSIALHDKARAALLHKGAKNLHGSGKAAKLSLLQIDSNIPAQASDHSVDVTNATTLYVVTIGVGSPAQRYDLVIDTGSFITFVGASREYVVTDSSKSTGKEVSVNYGSGSFSGKEFTDTVTLGKDLVIEKQRIGVASKHRGIPFDGILGWVATGLLMYNSWLTVPGRR